MWVKIEFYIFIILLVIYYIICFGFKILFNIIIVNVFLL